MRRATYALVIMTLMLGACSGGGDSATEASSPMDETAPDATAAADSAAQGGEPDRGESVSLAIPEGRQVIQEAELTMEAEDTRDVLTAVQQIVAASNGFVSNASVSEVDDAADQPRITVVVRVPAEGMAQVLDAIRAQAGLVVSESQRGTDVTEEYVDIEARLTNLRALEEELRALLAEVRARPNAEPPELLQVFNEVSRVRGEIEQLEGRQRLIDEQVSLATVTVTIVPAPIAAPVVQDGWNPLVAVREAAADLVLLLQGAVDLAIRTVVFVVPTLLLVGIPAYAAWWAYKRWWPRPAQPTPAE